jgi:hypothetical protein
MYVFSRTYMNNGILDLFLRKPIVDVIAFQKNISRFKAFVFTYFTQNQFYNLIVVCNMRQSLHNRKYKVHAISFNIQSSERASCFSAPAVLV